MTGLESQPSAPNVEQPTEVQEDTNGGANCAHPVAAVDRRQLESVLDPHYEPSIPFDQAIHRAAVAAVLRAGTVGPELLFIERAARAGDPWSGQIAFPGGRTDPVDTAPIETARRETREELGLHLPTRSHIGTLAEVDGGRATNRLMLVSAHAFWLDGDRPRLTPNYEVGDTLWVPLTELANPDRHIDYHYPPAGADFPGVRLDGLGSAPLEAAEPAGHNPAGDNGAGDDRGRVLWGLTLRFVAELFQRLGQPIID